MKLDKQKIYDMRSELKSMSDQMAELIAKDDFDPEGEAYKTLDASMSTLKGKIAAAEKQLALEESLGEQKKGFEPAGGDAVCQKGLAKGLKMSSVKAIAAVIRKAMTEGVLANGGYTVPEDVVSRIYTLIEDRDTVLSYIRNTPVTKESGARTYKKRKQMTGFATVAETAKIPAMAEPTFAQIEYKIEKRGGYLPASIELLEDSDEDITNIILGWIADEAAVTINKNTMAKAMSQTPETLTGLDDILKVLTTGLGSSLRAISTIHTNDSGLLYLITLKDANGRALLNPDPTQPARMLLSVGAVSVPIKVWSNETMPSTEGGAIPFVIGSLSEGIERFDRKVLTIERFDQATFGDINLAEQYMIAFRAVMRDDYQLRDAEAFKYCTLTPAAAG